MEVAAFVDGLNLYNGMRASNQLKYRWLDVHKMCHILVGDTKSQLGLTDLSLSALTYCTSFVNDDKGQRRQDLFVQALQAHRPATQVIHGRYEAKGRDCDCHCGCHNVVEFQKEKRTDVNLAVEMMKTASAVGGPEVLMLVTGDTDLIPAVAAAREVFGRTVVVVMPPARGRTLDSFAAVADLCLRVGIRHLKYAPLPSTVIRPDNGFTLTPPYGWADPATW